MTEPSAGGRFVYGLNVHGLERAKDLRRCPSAGRGGVQVRVEMRADGREADHALDADRSVEAMGPAHQWVLERAPASACLVGPRLDDDLLAHPSLAPVAVVFNRWAGRESFHAASFESGDRAFGVIGRRTAGKSTLMAGLAARGVPVLSDDIVISDGRVVFAGPRCVDLRSPIPHIDLELASARFGSRWRLPLPAAPAQLPLGGWIFLRWGSEVSMERCPPSLVLARLARWRGRHALASDPTMLLDLATRPAWDLTRPRDWAAFEQVTSTLTGTLDASARPARR
jgi:hypothetical protein